MTEQRNKERDLNPQALNAIQKAAVARIRKSRPSVNLGMSESLKLKMGFVNRKKEARQDAKEGDKKPKPNKYEDIARGPSYGEVGYTPKKKDLTKMKGPQ